MKPLDENEYEDNEELRKFGYEVKDKTKLFIKNGIVFLASLAWNDAIRTIIDKYYPLEKDNIQGKFIYAIVMTLIIICALHVIDFGDTEKDLIKKH